MVVGEIAAGWTALNGAMTIAKGLKNVDDKVRVNEAVIELQEKILAALEGAAATRQKMESLEQLLEGYEKWDHIAARYALKDFGSGTFAYQFIAEGQPLHLACPACFQKRQLSILQFKHKTYSRDYQHCPCCDQTFILGSYVKPEAPQVNTRRGRYLDGF